MSLQSEQQLHVTITLKHLVLRPAYCLWYFVAGQVSVLGEHMLYRDGDWTCGVNNLHFM